MSNGAQELMTKLPKRPPVDIEFQDITFCVSEGRNKGFKKILKNVSGKFRSGHMTAILGHSGAGKSTLMNITAGYRYSNVGGTILVNGRERDLRRFRKMACYIMQNDHLHAHLTVRESMSVSANLKLGNKMKRSEKEEIIREILDTLNLTDCIDTRANSLSGGERKRLSIALELVNNPPVMFFDEPTSGLDSSSSFQCINLLKNLAKGGRTIICTIHQPSARLFESFDYLFALAEGQFIYRGVTKGLISYLSSLGLHCPSYHNPADFLLEVTNGDYGDYNHQLASAVEDGMCLKYEPESEVIERHKEAEDDTVNSTKIPLLPPTKLANGGNEINSDADDTLEKKNSNLETHLAIPSTHDALYISDDGEHGSFDAFPTSGWRQFLIIFKRSFICIYRDTLLTKLRIYTHFFVGILISLFYYNIGNEASKILNNSSCLFICLTFLMYSSIMPTLLTFPLEMNVFMKEYLNYWYTLKSYYLARTFADIPFQVILPFIYLLLVYFLSDQPLEAGRFFMFSLITILTSLVAQTLGLVIGASTTIEGAVFIGPVSTIPILLFSGFFAPYSTIPVYLRWITYLSYVRYGFEGALLSIYGFNREKLNCSEPYCHFKSPEKFLDTMDVGNIPYWANVLALFGYFLLLRVAGYFVLRWKLKAER
ncbi:ATP-binding cassette sub-family G member 1 [Armadillidium nasatum]|uniref:ATP-binding cassette sub-family G member 1 n=1 Tax=Armadillidium nasatum TaxID=96803 RepID=A0A5N5TMA7_9CRUS|nr:ATP-binding cassette sub-family G member 1 [Armadillidium nasatum]